MSNPVVQPLVIAVLVIAEVCIWQSRVARANRGQKSSAAVLGAVGALVYVFVISQVVANVDQPLNAFGYAVGVSAGVFLGCLADERTGKAPLEYRMVIPADGGDVVAGLRAAGWPVTALGGDGLGGSAVIAFVAVDVAAAVDLEGDLERLAPHAFWTVEQLRSAKAVNLPEGVRALKAAT